MSGNRERPYPVPLPAGMNIPQRKSKIVIPSWFKRILGDGVDNNIGKLLTVPPSPILDTGPDLAPLVELLRIEARPQQGEYVTVTMAQIDDQNAPDQFAGPCQGIIQFGSAGALTTAEVSIPAPVQANNDYGAAFGSPRKPLMSGVSVSLPVSTIHVYARNDGNTPQIADPTLPMGVRPTAVATVGAWLSYGTKPSTVAATRWVVCYANGPAPAGLAPASVFQVAIPPFARRMRFQRFPVDTTTLLVSFISFQNPNQTISGGYAVPVNEDGVFELSGAEMWANVFTGGAAPINSLIAYFDIAI